MKKLLFLFMILGLVSVANAGIVDIVITSLNGEAIDPAVREIDVRYTDIIDLAIIFEAPADEYLVGCGVTINIDGLASLDLSQTTAHAAFDPLLHAVGPDWIVEAASYLGPQGVVEPLKVIENILIHCDSDNPINDVYVYLTDDPLQNTYVGDENFNPVDWSYGPGVVIHQIPEPMTLTLLGLGGLFLARRKK